MTGDFEVKERLARVEMQVKTHADNINNMNKTLTSLNTSVAEILAVSKAFRWVIGVTIALGPTLGVIFAKLLDK